VQLASRNVGVDLLALTKAQPVLVTRRFYRKGKAYFLKQKPRSIIATQKPRLAHRAL
jgi:hypothetical protein